MTNSREISHGRGAEKVKIRRAAGDFQEGEAMDFAQDDKQLSFKMFLALSSK